MPSPKGRRPFAKVSRSLPPVKKSTTPPILGSEACSSARAFAAVAEAVTAALSMPVTLSE